MNAINVARTLFGDDPDPARSAAVATATTEITALMRAVVWLLQNRVQIAGFEGWGGIGGDHLRVTCVASPKLWALFKDECEYQRVDHDGRTWVASKFGVQIRWKERT